MSSAARGLEADVAIVGAGPVGLTLAIDLAGRGVGSIVLETRHRGEPPSVKCNHVAARSMEQFRRLGVAADVRDAGLPPDYPNDVVFRTTVTGTELARIHIPAGATRYTRHQRPRRLVADARAAAPDQPDLPRADPVRARRRRNAGVTIRNRDEVDRVRCRTTQASPRPRATSTAAPSDAVAGALPGRLRRRPLDRAQGDRRDASSATPVIQRVQSTYIRAPTLLVAHPGRAAPGAATRQPAPQRRRSSRSTAARPGWSTTTCAPTRPTSTRSIATASIRTILGVGADFAYEVISKEDWFGRRLVADRFRDRRVFICGDAAHLWVPYAGYGMNAGIADAREPRLAARRAPRRLGRRRRSSTPTSASGCRSPSRSRTSRWTTRSR